MKYFIGILISVFMSQSGVCQSQKQLDQQAKENYMIADREMNIVYKRILKEYASDMVFIKNFKAAQRIWIQFRDAEVKSKYPDREAGYYGSIHGMCVNDYLAELTKERTRKLSEWLEGAEEGDVCSGSIQVREE